MSDDKHIEGEIVDIPESERNADGVWGESRPSTQIYVSKKVGVDEGSWARQRDDDTNLPDPRKIDFARKPSVDEVIENVRERERNFGETAASDPGYIVGSRSSEASSKDRDFDVQWSLQSPVISELIGETNAKRFYGFNAGKKSAPGGKAEELQHIMKAESEGEFLRMLWKYKKDFGLFEEKVSGGFLRGKKDKYPDIDAVFEEYQRLNDKYQREIAARESRRMQSGKVEMSTRERNMDGEQLLIDVVGALPPDIEASLSARYNELYDEGQITAADVVKIESYQDVLDFLQERGLYVPIFDQTKRDRRTPEEKATANALEEVVNLKKELTQDQVGFRADKSDVVPAYMPKKRVH